MILLIDDEKKYVENLIDELQALDVKVLFCSSVDKALSIGVEKLKELEAVVCDIMMPHGHSFSAAETENNRLTGLLLLQKLRDLEVEAPVILLTNLNLERAPVEDRAKKFPPCEVIRKSDGFSFEIAERIKDAVTHGRVS